ncbi:hypothetical protein ACFWIB_15355 [Streptomyces sp. NPDC127051]|uniref:hypothetical protein n=1 Tax=Streptomyces sp. NPDC127051 TaxID=3347119 RepID=UPI00364B73E2
MNRTSTTLAVGAAGIALLAAACSSEPSYSQRAEQCITAVKALPKGAQAEPRPKACAGVKDEDYNVIFASKVMDDTGWPDAATDGTAP